MRKSIIIPTYWARESGQPWQEGDAVYDHPTPVDQEGTLQRTLESMKLLEKKDFKLVLLICPTTPEVEIAARRQVVNIVEKVQLNAETYLFTASALREMLSLLKSVGLRKEDERLLSMSGYANVRNMCLLAASILTADAAILIDDDEVFELPDYVTRSLEFLGSRVYGDTVHGVAGYYLNKDGHYYDDVVTEPWMTYWNRFDCKAKAFDKIIGSGPRLKRTTFAFGGAMVLSRDLFECVPFDPLVTRGEDIDYLICSRMYGFSFFLDNTLSIKHLPMPKTHPQWKRMREDIYRFVYQRSKIKSQYENGKNVLISAEDLDPYPGEFLKEDLEEKVLRGSIMLAMQYMTQGDSTACMEALQNIYICQHKAPPKFDAFAAYVNTQKSWERLIRMVRKVRYDLREILEHDNLSAAKITVNKMHMRKMSQVEILAELEKLREVADLTHEDKLILGQIAYIKTFFENEIVFSRGDFNDAACLVLRGSILIVSEQKKDENTPPIEMAVLSKGDMLGESCVVHDTYSLNGTATEFTELMCIDRTELNTLFNNNPVLGVKLLKMFLGSVSDKITRINEQKLSVSGYDHNRVASSAIESE